MFKQYLRYATGQPFGLVLVENNNFGYSLCCERDRFNKKRGEMIAKNRARTGLNWEAILKCKAMQPEVGIDKHKVEIKRNGEKIVYQSKIAAVVDKLEYLKEKLKIE